jgi:ABC-type multidrug transport system ATPase subunit
LTPAGFSGSLFSRDEPGLAAISVHGIKKSYGEVHAVKGIDFEIQPGEVFGSLAPNSAGKTKIRVHEAMLVFASFYDPT